MKLTDQEQNGTTMYYLLIGKLLKLTNIKSIQLTHSKEDGEYYISFENEISRFEVRLVINEDGHHFILYIINGPDSTIRVNMGGDLNTVISIVEMTQMEFFFE